jgi:preprotein translocase SecE subunit
MFRFLKEIGTELKATTWPKPVALLNLVLYTIILCGIIALIILGLDVFLLRIRDIIL